MVISDNIDLGLPRKYFDRYGLSVFLLIGYIINIYIIFKMYKV